MKLLHIHHMFPLSRVVNLLYSTSVLKFEDLLSLLPENILLDDFREEIVSSLQSTQGEIKSLRREMDDATVNAELIRQDLEAIKKQPLVVEKGAKCSLCKSSVLSDPFYVFPCHHCFHTGCLMKYVSQWCSSRTMKRAEELEKRILTHAPMETLTDEQRRVLDLYREELDQLIGRECLLCGDRMIESIDKPFIDFDLETNLINSWSL